MPLSDPLWSGREVLRDLALRLAHSPLFRRSRTDRDAFRRRLAQAPAAQTCGILFTPRSGSSRLTDLAAVWPALGRPDECFNPGFLPEMARKLNAGDLGGYVEMLRRRPPARETWSFEATPEHIRQVFLSDARFLRLTAPDRLVGLIRRDIVAQAVSVEKLRQTGLGHSVAASAAEVARADASVVYRPRRIAACIRRLAAMERRIDRLLDGFSGPVLLMTYEANSELSAHAIRQMLAAFLGVAPGPRTAEAERHVKIGTALNRAMARRFRADRPDFLARIEADRAPRLARYPQPLDDRAAVA